MVAKISADKGVTFDFTNNEKLKGSVFAIEGKTVNGYVNKDGVTVNIESAKALNNVVGHEITHVLEGTDLYGELQTALFNYAEGKKDLQSRRSALEELYKDVNGTDIDAELTADLVGDYLFTDQDFVNHLSASNRNVFQKIYDEVKYLCKVAGAGSKEARELERVKRVFEKAYGQEGSTTTSNVKYSLTGVDADGIEVYETSEETKNLSYSDRKRALLNSVLEEYKGRTAKFKKGGETYYAFYDEAGVRKGVYGDKKSDKNGLKAKINIGADGDYIELAENSMYVGSSNETGKKTASGFHDDAKFWDYYVKSIKSDGRYFDVLINVKDTGAENFVYDITLKEAASLPSHKGLSDGNSAASSRAGQSVKSETSTATTNIAPMPENVNTKHSLSEPGKPIAPVGAWNIRGEDVILGPVREDAKKTSAGSTMVSNIYNGVISDLQAEYDAMQDKTGSEAKNIINRIEKLKSELASVTGPTGVNGIKLGPERADAAPVAEQTGQTAAEAQTAGDPAAEETGEKLATKPVTEKIKAQIESSSKELENVGIMRQEAADTYKSQIADLLIEYDSKKNKNTKAANNILRRIEQLKRIKADVDAAYESRIANIEKRLEKLKSPTYSRAEQRKVKQSAFQQEISDLIGDTTTWVDKKLGIQYQTNTLKRNLRDIVRDATGKSDIARADRIYDYLQGTYNHNEAELKKESASIKQPFQNMKITKQESIHSNFPIPPISVLFSSYHSLFEASITHVGFLGNKLA